MIWEAWLGLGDFPTEADALTAAQKAALGIKGVGQIEVRRVDRVVDASEIPVPTTVEITPASFGLAVGEFVRLLATTYDQFSAPMGNSDGSGGLPIRSYQWSSSQSSVASASAGSGLVEAIAPGACTIQALDVLAGITDTTPAAIGVIPQPVDTLTATPATASGVPGGTATIALQPFDVNGNALSGRTVTGSSGNASVATVSVSGYTATITFVGAGSATITYTCETKTATTSVTVVAAGAFHEPTDVTMTERVSADFSQCALNTGMGTSGTLVTGTGLKWFTNGNNVKIQTISDQSWRPSSAAVVPACPNGQDRVMVCSWSSYSAGDKGEASIDNYGSPKTLYGRWYFLFCSDFYGQVAGTFKISYPRGTSANPGMETIIASGAGNATLNLRTNFFGTNSPGSSGNIGSLVRNQWYLIEYVIAAASGQGNNDGHVTIWKDGTRVYQRTGIIWDSPNDLTTFGATQNVILNFYGGTGTTSHSGTIFTVRGDNYYFSSSNQRCAVP